MDSGKKIRSSKELISRLESLNRGVLRNKIVPASQIKPPEISPATNNEPNTENVVPVIEIVKNKQSSPIVYRRDLPRISKTTPLAPSMAGYMRNVVLEESVKGLEIQTEFGAAYLVETLPSEEILSLKDIDSQFNAVFRTGMSNFRKRLLSDKKIGIDICNPGDVLIIDVESTGLGSTPLFLIGILEWDTTYGNDGIVVRQYLARNYAEEAAVIASFFRKMENRKLLVSFNGKSFDIPFIKARASVNRIAVPAVPHHFDLLHESRRIWKNTLPNCKLQTLELHICGRGRYGDIPGAQIPEAYHSYVRTSNAVELVEILKHNMLDMVTLAELMVKLPLISNKPSSKEIT